MRFRKSVKLAKGIRLNVSKSGVSTTIGGKGISLNIGKGGAYLNTSIPGTGLYDRFKLGNLNDMIGQVKRSVTGQPTQRSSAKRSQGTTSAPEIPEFSLRLGSDGQAVVVNAAGNAIRSEATLRAIKKTEEYKQMYDELMAEYREQIEGESDTLLTIHTLSSPVPSYDDYETILADDSEPEPVEPEPFDEPEPNLDLIRVTLESEAAQNVKTLAFWDVARQRQEYVNARLPEMYKNALAEYQRSKREFEAAERARVDAINRQAAQERAATRSLVKSMLSGAPDAVEDSIEGWLSTLELPVDFDLQFEYMDEDGVVMVDLDLPEIEDMPTEKAVELSGGAVKAKPKTQKERREDYVTCVFGLSVFFASHIFYLAPRARTVCVSGYTQRRSAKSGDMQDEYVFSVQYDRARFERGGYTEKNPYDFSMKCQNRVNKTATGELKPIVPYNYSDIEYRPE